MLKSVLVASVWAQGPGNGLSKTTYSATKPDTGAQFLLKYLPTTVAEDNTSGNVGQCAAGDSGQTSAWTFTQGRVQLVEDSNVGKCQLFTTDTGSIKRPAAAGDDCTYDAEGPAGVAADSLYETYAHNTDTCCKACAMDVACQSATYTESGLGMPEQGEGFGLHLVDIAGHTAYGLAVEDVEAAFESKLGDMTKFDAFMDYSVQLFTSDLDGYVKKFAADSVKYLVATSSGSSDTTVYSVFVHVPGTQMVLELLGLECSECSSPITLEQRLTDARIAQVQTSPPEGELLTAVGVSRASSDVSRMDSFYTDGVGATTTLTIDDKNSGVSKRCFQWPGAKADACFVTRASSATDDDFTVSDFETKLFAAHKALVGVNPNCGMDRWEDNHYAVDLGHGGSDFDALAEYVIESQEKAEPLYYTCGGGGPPHAAGLNGRPPPSSGGMHYVTDPTGWMIQLDLTISTSMPGCSSGGYQVSESPNCAGGTCTPTVAQVLV